MPLDVEEQKAIADTFIAADREIELLQQDIEQENKRKSPDAAVTDGHCEGENMTEKEMQEHLRKELLKKIVDNGQNYTEK